MDEATQHAGDGGKTGDPISERIANDVGAQARAQSSRAADGAQHAADAARRAAEDLRGQEAWMAGFIEQGADRLASLAQMLRNKDPRTLLADAEDFARRQPVLFTGAAMILGFALTRAAGMTAATARSAESTHGGLPRED